MNFLIIVSNQDPASLNFKEVLFTKYKLEKIKDKVFELVLSGSINKIYVKVIDSMHIFSKEEEVIEPDLDINQIIFLSKHSTLGEIKPKSLTVHAIGNWGKADLGGFDHTVIETDPTLPEANKFKMAFSFMKKKGVTKEALSIALTDAINIIENDRKLVFDADINKKNANIDSNIKLIADKKLAMQKLAEEIQQLENETETIKSKISTKTYLYNSFASQLIAKIKNDYVRIRIVSSGI
ncbi:MAG: D-aminoacyl-tRNA deacylase, partial [archaeon]